MSGVSSTCPTVAPVVSVSPVSVSPVSSSVPVSSLKFIQRDHKGLKKVCYELNFNILDLVDNNNMKFNYINRFFSFYSNKYNVLVYEKIRSFFRDMEENAGLIYSVRILNISSNQNYKIFITTNIEIIEENEENKIYKKNFECGLCYEEKEQETYKFCSNIHNIEICLSCLNKISNCPYCKKPIENKQDKERLRKLTLIEKILNNYIVGGEMNGVDEEDGIIPPFLFVINKINKEIFEEHFYNDNLYYPVSLKQIIKDKLKNTSMSNLYIDIFKGVGFDLSSFIIKNKDEKFFRNQNFDFMHELILNYIDIEPDHVSHSGRVKELTSIYLYIYNNIKYNNKFKYYIKPKNYKFKKGFINIFSIYTLYLKMTSDDPPNYKELLIIKDKFFYNMMLYNKSDIEENKNFNIKNCNINNDFEMKFKYQNKLYKYSINDFSENDINLYIIGNTKTKGRIKFNDHYDYIKFNYDNINNIQDDFLENHFKTNYYKYDNEILYQIIHHLNKFRPENLPFKFMIISTLNYFKNDQDRDKLELRDFYERYFTFAYYDKYLSDVMEILKYKEETQIKYFKFYKYGGYGYNSQNPQIETTFYLNFENKEDKNKYDKYFYSDIEEYYNGYHNYYHA